VGEGNDGVRLLTILLAAATVISTVIAIGEESTGGLVAAWLLITVFGGYLIWKWWKRPPNGD
jgi:hypothetical protein